MLLEDSAEKKHQPDNIDLCVRAAGRIAKRLGKRVTYGNYMGLYHDKENKQKKSRIKK